VAIQPQSKITAHEITVQKRERNEKIVITMGFAVAMLALWIGPELVWAQQEKPFPILQPLQPGVGYKTEQIVPVVIFQRTSPGPGFYFDRTRHLGPDPDLCAGGGPGRG
jgi:hypothetical protein